MAYHEFMQLGTTWVRRETQDAGDGWRNLLRAVGDVNCGYGAGTNEGVHSANEKIPMRGVKALAGLVQNQQAGILDQCPSKQNRPLETRRK